LKPATGLARGLERDLDDPAWLAAGAEREVDAMVAMTRAHCFRARRLPRGALFQRQKTSLGLIY